METKPPQTGKFGPADDRRIVTLVQRAIAEHREAIDRLSDLDYDISTFQKRRRKSIDQLGRLLDARPDERPWPEGLGEDFETLGGLEQELIGRAEQLIADAPPAVAVRLQMAAESKMRNQK